MSEKAHQGLGGKITMADIARIAGVSKPTVSRALRNSPLVNPDTKERVLAVARAHGYAANANAQKLRHKRLDTIAVGLDFPSFPDNHVPDPFVFELLASVSEGLAVRNQDLLLCQPGMQDKDLHEYLITSRRADGIIFIGLGHRERELLRLARAGTPFVVWGGTTEDVKYCVIGGDNLLGGQLAARHLTDVGRRRLLFLGTDEHVEIRLRGEGFVCTATSAGAKVDTEPLEDFSYKASHSAVCRYLERNKVPPDGVFACSDLAAMAAVNALRDAGHRIPEDVAVVGYDDIPTAALFYPPLTTIRQDFRLAGAILVEKLMQILDGAKPEPVKLKTELIVRGSSAAV